MTFKYRRISVLTLASFIMFQLSVVAQVGIETTLPKGVLDINSETMGVIPPKVTLSSTIVDLPVVNPQGGNLVNGTLVYNTLAAGTYPYNVVEGYYYWDTDKWKPFGEIKPMETAKFRDTNSTDNVNPNSNSQTRIDIIDDLIFNDNPALFVHPGGDDEIIVSQAGRYEIIANIFLRNVGGNECSISFRVQVEDGISGALSLPGSGAVVYFSGNNNDTYRTTVVHEVLQLKAGDIVSVRSKNIDGDDGNDVVLNNSVSIGSNFLIRKLIE